MKTEKKIKTTSQALVSDVERHISSRAPQDRYDRALYGAVCIVPRRRRLVNSRIQYDNGTGRNGRWAVDAVCFSKERGAFTSEYRSLQRVYLHPERALMIIRSVCSTTSPDRMYAEWLAANKCKPWAEVVRAAQGGGGE